MNYLVSKSLVSKILTPKNNKEMKKFITTIVILLAASFLSAQEGIVPADLLIDHRWQDGETRTIFSHPTTQIFGQRVDTKLYQNVGEVTNIGYYSVNQVLENIGSKWKQRGVHSEEAQHTADSLKKVAPGGYLYLYIERFLENRANLQYFFIIIRDKDDKTLYTKNFQYQAPNVTAIRDTWWNYIVTEIPIELEYPFFVYVNDKQSQHLSDFKFKINDIEWKDVEIISVDEMEE
jgi:hypothetical protein